MKSLYRRLLLAGASLLVATACAQPRATPAAAPVTSAESLIAAMHERYADSWYRTLRFRQKVIYAPAANGTTRPNEVWLEHGEIPGKLRIDVGQNYSGNGTIYAGDSVFSFQNGKVMRRQPGGNPLMVLGFDVYRQPVAKSIEALEKFRFDMTKFRTDTWQGRPVYVVGATDPADLRSPQFWIDQERLVFVRLLQPAGQSGNSDIRFDNYVKFGGTWIAPLVVFLRDGKEVMREEYFDMEANVTIPEGLFNPDMLDKIKPVP